MRHVLIVPITLLCIFLLCIRGTVFAQTPLRIGVLNDMSGIYADIAGSGSVMAARMAVEDFGGSALGRL